MTGISLFWLIASSVRHINSKIWNLSEYFLFINLLTHYSLLTIIFSSISPLFSLLYPILNFILLRVSVWLHILAHIDLLQHSIYSFTIWLKIFLWSTQSLCNELKTSYLAFKVCHSLVTIQQSSLIFHYFSPLDYSHFTKFIPHLPLSLCCTFSSA